MTLLDVMVAALIRGLADVLPLDASGHLAVLGLRGAPEGRAAVAVAAEMGMAVALALYFWRDLAAMGGGLWRLVKGKPDAGSRLLLQVITGTAPALLLAWVFIELGGDLTVGKMATAAAMLVFGLFLYLADKLGVTVRRIEHMSWAGAFAIGLLQATALVPGVSRTGITITAARLMGYERQDAARFSLLLAIPLVGAQAGYDLWQLSTMAPLILSADLLAAAALSCLGAFIAAAALMAWLDRNTLLPFALWSMGLGAVVLAVLSVF